MTLLNNLSVNWKINLIAFIVLVSFSIFGTLVYKKLNVLKNAYEETNKTTTLSTLIHKTYEEGLQLTSALRRSIIKPNDTKAKNNFLQTSKKFDINIKQLEKSSSFSKGYKKFQIEKLYNNQKIVLNNLLDKINKNKAFSEKDEQLLTKNYRPFKEALGEWEKRNLQKIKKLDLKFQKTISDTISFTIVLILITILVILTVIQIIASNIKSSLESFNKGLTSFFSFINRQSDQAGHIDLNSKDEFGLMAKELNKAIDKSVDEIKQDNKLIKEIDDILEKIDNGFYFYTVKGSSSNPMTNSIKEKVNQLVKGTDKQLQIIVDTLTKYGNSDFRYNYDKKENENMNGSFGSLVASSMLIGNNVSELIGMILNAGEKLNDDTDILKGASNNLATSSNKQAASLEETAAALEEITSTVVNNNENISTILNYSKQLSDSVNKGQTMANETALSMDEINTQVNDINEAISVIDQIAFQTNILSLNAAVEAAKAGDTGKGFAVVAGEVRNLANRSAEAASQIKDMVHNANEKTNTGKKISDDMITGYKTLNQNIQNTVELINNIASSSKEQQQGLEQINDAVSQLDQETQLNAMEASKINELVLEVSSLSSDLVTAANRAEFKKEAREQVEDVELVFQTAKLKNDHITFKMNNFKQLDKRESIIITDHHSCNLGKWVDKQIKDNKSFTKTASWDDFMKNHKLVHDKVKEFMDRSANYASNEELKKISQEIEHSTIAVFKGLNQVKIENGKELKLKKDENSVK